MCIYKYIYTLIFIYIFLIKKKDYDSKVVCKYMKNRLLISKEIINKYKNKMTLYYKL